MRPGTVSNPRSASQRRARSTTPGLSVRFTPRVDSFNYDTFLQFEHNKIPFNSLATQQESGKEEFTAQLKLLKNQLNRTKFHWNTIESKLSKTKTELSKIENTEKLAEAKTYYLNQREKQLLNDLSRIKRECEFAVIDHNGYIYVKQRMTITAVFYDLKAAELKEKLKVRNEVLRNEERKQLKSTDAYGMTINKYRMFQIRYKEEDRKRDLLVRQFDKDVDCKQNLADTREEMIRRRAEIVESVANEDKNQRNNFLREGLLVHRTWCRFLNQKLQREKHRFAYIEKAYANIRSLTGLSNIHEVVQKILTRENSYSSLMNMILESKKVCERYAQRNNRLEKELNDIIVRDSADKKHSDIMAKSSIVKLFKKISSEKEKHMKLIGSKSYVLVWVKKMLKNINANFEDDSSVNELFGCLKTTIHEKLKILGKRGNRKITNISYPLRQGRKFNVELENIRVSDLVYAEEDQPEVSPSMKAYRKKNTKSLI